MTTFAQLTGALALVAANGLFVAAEFALTRLRPDIVATPTTASAREAAERALAHGYSRLPVYHPQSGLDGTVGVVHLTDLLDAVMRDPTRPVGELAHPLLTVRPSTRIDSLMRRLAARHQHMAMVVDKHGTTKGLITLEDIVEEIVGQIEDESDRPQPLRIALTVQREATTHAMRAIG